MKIILEGNSKEIAALVLAIQERQSEKDSKKKTREKLSATIREILVQQEAQKPQHDSIECKRNQFVKLGTPQSDPQ